MDPNAIPTVNKAALQRLAEKAAQGKTSENAERQREKPNSGASGTEPAGSSDGWIDRGFPEGKTCRYCEEHIGAHIATEWADRKTRVWMLDAHQCDAYFQAVRDQLSAERAKFLERIQNPNAETLRKIRDACRLPRRSFPGLAALKETPQNRPALEAARKLLKDFQANKRDRGLYIYGDLGTGKTTLLAALAFDLYWQTGTHEVEEPPLPTASPLSSSGKMQRVVDWGWQASVQFWPVSDWFTTMGRAISGQTEYHPQRVERCDALLLDDLGKQYDTAFKVTELFRVINYRYNECLSTSFTSNFDPEQMGERMARTLGRDHSADVMAMIDRILETCTVVELKGSSWRTR